MGNERQTRAKQAENARVANDMQQLPLAISPPPEPGFDNFLAGSNAEALARVRALAQGALREAVIYLWGEPGSGRSHLLRAAARANSSLVIADDVPGLDAPAQQAAQPSRTLATP